MGSPSEVPGRSHPSGARSGGYGGDGVRQGDVVEVAERAKAQLRIKGAAEAAEGRGFPEWIEVDIKALKGTFKAKPQRSELPSTINESLVVELYSNRYCGPPSSPWDRPGRMFLRRNVPNSI